MPQQLMNITLLRISDLEVPLHGRIDSVYTFNVCGRTETVRLTGEYVKEVGEFEALGMAFRMAVHHLDYTLIPERNTCTGLAK